MPACEVILWLGSLAPDRFEEDVLRALSVRQPRVCHSIEEAIAIAATESVDLLFANFPAIGGTALELLDGFSGLPDRPTLIIRDPTASVQDAMRLARLGLDHLIGIEADPDDILDRVNLCISDRGSRRRVDRTSAATQPSGPGFLVGESRPMARVSQLIQLVAGRRCTLLITGETGTGKEVAARAVHLASPRAAAPFVAVNCSALPEHLLEAELFGSVKGAFTGAHQLRIGRFEQANRGTLFLDEIGDMPSDLQAKLLRVLQEREFQRLGSSDSVHVDVRIIAATNVDLAQRVRQGAFREDLYYRLNVVPVPMPPLRARPGDIPALVHHFLGKICREESLPVKTVSGEALRALMSRRWPGNVRQLENAVEMAIVLSGLRQALDLEDFPDREATETLPAPASAVSIAVPDHGIDFQQTVDQFERNILSQALKKTRGNKKQAAEMLGLKRTTLSAKVRLLESAAGCPLI